MKYQGDQLKSFSKQIDFVLGNYQSHGLKISSFQNVIIGGLGGSGIGGRIAKMFFQDTLPTPCEVISDYSLPAYVGSQTLVIASSYSGNTEESLSMFDEALKKGAKIICISTGGKLKEKALNAGVPFYAAEPGFQPRMALGYSLPTLLLIFSELLGDELKPEISKLSQILANTDVFLNRAMDFFSTYSKNINRKFVIIADKNTEPVGLRLCQQIQENAKEEAFLHIIPEMNHNVIESYYGIRESNFIFLYTHSNTRVQARFEFMAELFKSSGYSFSAFIVPEWNLQSLFETIYVLDWFSLILADAKGVNSMQIPNINALKGYLDKL